jgi:tRNA(His) guanylyltransferase
MKGFFFLCRRLSRMKKISVLAGEASAKFSILLGDGAAFDCRISQLPQIEDIVDYYFDELPNWQKRGTGVLWEIYDKARTNPLTGEAVVTTRRRMRVEFNCR